MAHFWTSEIDEILSAGHSLVGSGVRNWALERAEAIVALDELLALSVGVLGGDVYSISDTTLEANYDNWFCNPVSGESEDDFLERSIAKAKSYIANYPSRLGNVAFAIVPRVD
jgi:23S rRNA A1618 N6-methylase RlmF